MYPTKIPQIIKNIYLNSSCCIKTENDSSEFFNIETGARQEYLLSPFLFLLVMDFILKTEIDDTKHGIQWYNQQHLADLDFAHDIVLIARTFGELEDLTYRLYDEEFKVGLKVNDEKTKSMQIMDTSNNRLSIQNKQIEDVDAFAYLGSVVSTEGGAEEDIKRRLGKAMWVFQKFQKIWSLPSISMKIKLHLYNTIVVPEALYASETWKSTASISKKLDVFHQRCLQKILKMSYLDRVKNDEVIRRAQSRRLQDIVTERRVKFAGHILRMSEDRPAEVAMKWQPLLGKRKRGRPKITWRKTFKKYLSNVNKSWKT